MKSIDGEIEKILNKEYREYNDNESINFVNDCLGTGKNVEYINFQDDKKIEETTQDKIHNQMEENDNKYQMDYLKSIIFSQKPFFAEKNPAFATTETIESFGNTNNMKLGNLEELLGLNGNNSDVAYENNISDVLNRVDTPEKTEYNISQPNIEDSNQFISDLFLAENKVSEQSKQHFNDTLFGTPNIGNEHQPVQNHSSRCPQPTIYQNMNYTPNGNYQLQADNTNNTSFQYARPGQGQLYRKQSAFVQKVFPGNSMYTDPHGNSQGRSSASSNRLLFRNPALHQNSFNPQAYCKIKRRRRISSNTWSSAGNLLTFHPSKLSSFEFVHGGMNFTPQSGINGNLAFTPSQGPDNVRVVENFKKHISNLDFDNITVHELKNIMKDYGLNPNGKKKEMIDRIRNTLKELGIKKEENKPAHVFDARDDPLYDKYFF